MPDFPRNPRRRRVRRALGVAALLLAAVALRATGLGSAPRPFETVDEYHYMWCGLSLMSEGTPTSWSWLPVYENSPYDLGMVHMADLPLMFVRPALDHPPLYSLLAGAFAWATGAERQRMTTDRGNPVSVWKIGLARARWLSVALFAISFLLVYDLAARRWGYASAMAALLFYSATSHMVLHSRMIVTETLSVPLFLASLCAWERYRTGKTSERRFATAIFPLALAAPLVKLVAICQPAAIVVLLLAGKRRRAALYPLLGLAAGLGLVLLYAAWQGWGAYWLIQGHQSERFSSFSALRQIVTRPMLVQSDGFDLPIFLGWLALPGAAFGNRRSRGGELLSASLVFLAGYVFFSSTTAIFGWHLQPFYPFLAMALGSAFVRVWRELRPAPYCVAIALLLPTAFETVLIRHLPWLHGLRAGYLAVASGALLLACFPSPQGRKLQRLVLGLALAATMTGEIGDVLKDSGPMPPQRNSLTRPAPDVP